MGISDYISWAIIPAVVIAGVAVVLVIIFRLLRKSNIIGLYKSQMEANTEMTKNMSNMAKNMFNSQQNNAGNVNIDTTNLSGNVFFYFDGHMYAGQVGFCNLRIDDREPIKVFPGTPLGLDVDPGIHTIFVTYPRQGNEVYPAKAQFEIKQDAKYQIIYKFPITKFAPSQISINIIHND